MSETTANTSRPGEVIAFVSAKGGAGKTILAASLAYVLTKCEKKVVAIDLDFSTRGLSLYLLGGVVESQDILIAPENAVADALRFDVPSSSVRPRVIVRDDVAFNVVFPNREFYDGGSPDASILGLRETEIDTKRYQQFIEELFESLRRRYEYVVVDTRGGVDFTSGIPAQLADGYVVVIEADQLSFDQAGGLIKTLAEQGRGGRGSLKGFIVNKALFSS